MAQEMPGNELRMLAGNLAALWNGGRTAMDSLVAASGDPRLSPWAALRRLSAEETARLFSGESDRRQLSDAVQALTRYLTEPTWFDRAASEDERLRALRDHPIAYFCMEFGLASWLPMYSGGLGILAGDVLKEASDMGLPMVGVGLLYRQGFFYQHLDSSDYQTETAPTVNPEELPLELATDSDGAMLLVSIPVEDRQIHACIWKLQVGRIPLYYLDTDVAANDREDDRAITASLYGGDQTTRLLQEMVLGIGGMRALRALGITPSVYSMNEGHAAFLGVELLCEHLTDGDFQAALERTRSRIVYTNHTVVPAGNDVFDPQLVRRYLGTFAAELDMDRIVDLATAGNRSGFSMAVLAFEVSGKANAVSRLHAEIIPREWPGFAVEAVTNGVHGPTWVGPEIAALLDEFVPDWRGDDPEWNAVRSIPADRLQLARSRQRARMIEYVNRVQDRVRLDPNVLTIAWARRFAEYKRAWLIASDLGRLSRLLSNPEHPVQLVIAGKSHPRDEGGKRMMQGLLHHLRQDPAVAQRVVFVENYDEQVGRFLTMGADVWLNTPRKPLEASGTSGMKSSDNGGLQLTVTDGWAAEVDWWGTGWGIAGTGDESDALQLYQYLEDSIAPTFYCRDADGVAQDWVGMMHNTMIATLADYSARRMVLEYLHKMYLPLLERQGSTASHIV